MKIVKTDQGYKIRNGWLFPYFVKEHARKLEDFASRKDLVFDTFQEANEYIKSRS